MTGACLEILSQVNNLKNASMFRDIPCLDTETIPFLWYISYHYEIKRMPLEPLKLGNFYVYQPSIH